MVTTPRGSLFDLFRERREADCIQFTRCSIINVGNVGTPEKGSPVIPRTPEAIVLHYADESDATLRGWVDHVNRDAPSGVSWTSWSKMHEGELYVGPRDIEEE